MENNILETLFFTGILAYAYDNVSADKLFKENIYLLG
jgi:hypothetical protein